MKPEEVDDVIVGCSFPEGEQGMNYGRIIAMGAGLPISTSGMVVNRFCSSGIQAIADATAKVRAGWSDVIIAGGCETMSHIPMGGSIFRPNPDWAFDGSMPNVYVSMGITAENVAASYNISREDMDKFGLESNRRAFEAIKVGKFKEEIIPIEAFKYKTLQAGWNRDSRQFIPDDRRRCFRPVDDSGKGQGTGFEAVGQAEPLRRCRLQGGRDGGGSRLRNSQSSEDGGIDHEGHRCLRDQ